MFSSLRQGNLFYILDKGGDAPTLKIGQVVSVSNPVPKYGTSYQAPLNGGMETVVDISVKVGDETLDYKKVPAAMSIYGEGNVVVSESREAMSAEIEALARTSQSRLDSREYDEAVVAACDGMQRQLSPRYAKEKEQEEKIDKLEGKVTGMETTLSEIHNMLSNVIKTSSTAKSK